MVLLLWFCVIVVVINLRFFKKTASAATQEAMWQAWLLEQMGMCVDLPIKLYEDNKSAIMFTDHSGDHRITKHIVTRKEFARDAQTKGSTELVYVPTEEQTR